MGNMLASVSVSASPGNPKLLDRVRDVLRRKHYSFRTEQTYTDWIRRFILFHNKRHPSNFGEDSTAAFEGMTAGAIQGFLRNVSGEVSKKTRGDKDEDDCGRHGRLYSFAM
jgi:hypothetical protein